MPCAVCSPVQEGREKLVQEAKEKAKEGSAALSKAAKEKATDLSNKAKEGSVALSKAMEEAKAKAKDEAEAKSKAKEEAKSKAADKQSDEDAREEDPLQLLKGVIASVVERYNLDSEPSPDVVKQLLNALVKSGIRTIYGLIQAPPCL